MISFIVFALKPGLAVNSVVTGSCYYCFQKRWLLLTGHVTSWKDIASWRDWVTWSTSFELLAHMSCTLFVSTFRCVPITTLVCVCFAVHCLVDNSVGVLWSWGICWFHRRDLPWRHLWIVNHCGNFVTVWLVGIWRSSSEYVCILHLLEYCIHILWCTYSYSLFIVIVSFVSVRSLYMLHDWKETRNCLLSNEVCIT